MLSCGTPNAYFYKFHCGGLFALIKEYSTQQNNCYVRSEAGLHDSLLIRERFDLASSQAIAILVTSFVNDVSISDSVTPSFATSCSLSTAVFWTTTSSSSGSRAVIPFVLLEELTCRSCFRVFYLCTPRRRR